MWQRNLFTVVAIACGAAALVWIGSAALPSGIFEVQSVGPRIDLPCRLDLGEGKPSAVLTGDFPIHNAGDEPLSFQITSSCGCTQLTPNSGIVAPGDFRKITVGLEPTGVSDARRDVVLAISTNDRTEPNVQYWVTGISRPVLSVVPRMADFGQVGLHESKTVRLAMRMPKRELLSGAQLLPAIRCDSERFSVAIQRADGKVWIYVTLAPTEEVGVFREAFQLVHAATFESVPVAVSWHTLRPLMTSPVSLVLDASDIHEKCSRTLLVWRADGAVLGPLAGVTDNPGWIEVSDTSSEPSARRRLNVVLSADRAVTWNEPIALNLAFDGIQDTVEVPIRCAALASSGGDASW